MDRTMICLAAAILAISISEASAASPPQAPVDPAQNACEREMLRASHQRNIPVNVLYAVSLTETGRGGQLDPFAINVEGKAAFSRTRAEAMEKVQQARAQRREAHRHRLHADQPPFSWREFRVSRGNVRARAQCRLRSAIPDRAETARGQLDEGRRALPRGPGKSPAQKTYVCAVIRNMVYSGLGAWTPEGKSFCSAMG